MVYSSQQFIDDTLGQWNYIYNNKGIISIRNINIQDWKTLAKDVLGFTLVKKESIQTHLKKNIHSLL